MPGRAQPGRLAAPEWGAGRQREQRPELGQETVDDLDRLFGVVHRDVDVEPEDELTTRDVLHLIDKGAIAIARSDALALEEAEGVRSGRAHP